MLKKLIAANLLDAATLLTIETDLQAKKNDVGSWSTEEIELIDQTLDLIDQAFAETRTNVELIKVESKEHLEDIFENAERKLANSEKCHCGNQWSIDANGDKFCTPRKAFLDSLP